MNSIHIYEPCVLRRLVIPLLREIPEDNPCYRKARDLDARLMRFEPIDAELVPANSMLREFFGSESRKRTKWVIVRKNLTFVYKIAGLSFAF